MEYYESDRLTNVEPVSNSDLKRLFKNHPPACIQAMLTTSQLSNASQTNFNLAALTLARWYRNAGISEETLLKDAQGFCDLNFPDSYHYPTLDAKLRHLQEQYHFVNAHAAEYPFSCGYPKSFRSKDLIQFTCESCPLDKKRRDAKIPDVAAPFILENGLALYERRVVHAMPLVEEIVGTDNKFCLADPTNVGKSLVGHQMGIALATGADDLLGFRIPKPRRVLYLNFEMSDEQFHNRHQLLCSVLSI